VRWRSRLNTSTDRDAHAGLEQLAPLKNLRQLHLEGTEINADSFSQLPLLPKLQILYIDENLVPAAKHFFFGKRPDWEIASENIRP
jgi:hypothetical protein